ncbi:wd repeat sam and u-box domain-containing protein [Anaeramoeba flamelloides]|uniref:Wd repeat sam and u-box domain-containing protein n=1 Tax=Anaeramoeba flamelloides TaxID=1746091 RepID=A0AAV7Z579_9EUKA|nr:wd repeat sam and u-box domain-containing protein [Anaeramoeba flamelloides]
MKTIIIQFHFFILISMNRYTFKQPQSNYYENSEDSEDDIPEEVIKVPEEFLGPISFCLFKNPVKASDGFTYEQAEIEDWIDRCKKKYKAFFSNDKPTIKKHHTGL